MTVKRTKLELTWIGKDERPRLEPRILLEDQELSHHAVERGPNDIFDNRLIFGDNLLALKALDAEFSSKIKCVYIDPPYNTAFRADAAAFPNLNVKKIPKAVMHRCEWGRDDYSLEISALPEPPSTATAPEPAAAPRRRRATRGLASAPTLFTLDEESPATEEEA